jgi:hypothetical protein
MHSSCRIEGDSNSGRIVAYPDRTPVFGDYLRIAGYSTGTENSTLERLDSA